MTLPGWTWPDRPMELSTCFHPPPEAPGVEPTACAEIESPKQTKIRLTNTSRITRVKRTQTAMTKTPIAHVVKSNRDPVAELFPARNRSGHILQRDSRAVKGCYLFVGLTAGGTWGRIWHDSPQRRESVTPIMTPTFVMSTSIVGKSLSAEWRRRSSAKAICLQKFV